MKCNIGITDKVIRYVAGFAIIGLGLYFQSWWGAIGLIPVAVAATGWCPPYALLGIDTHKKEDKPAVEEVVQQQQAADTGEPPAAGETGPERQPGEREEK